MSKLKNQDPESEQPKDDFPVTRLSLLNRIRHVKNPTGWGEFVDIYGRLIYRSATKKGLNDAEAQDVVQETYIAAAKGIQKFKHTPNTKSFRRWLRSIVTRKIADQYRKRMPVFRSSDDNQHNRRTSTIDRFPDTDKKGLEAMWDAEWNDNLLEAIITRVKKQASIEQYQIYDLYVIQNWSALKVAKVLGISLTSVYLAKHRVGVLFKQAKKAIEKAPWKF